MNDDWQELATYTDFPTAEFMIGLLGNESVPVRVLRIEPIPGLAQSIRISVPSEFLHRAKLIVADAEISDAELNYLATGNLGKDEGAKSS